VRHTCSIGKAIFVTLAVAPAFIVTALPLPIPAPPTTRIVSGRPASLVPGAPPPDAHAPITANVSTIIPRMSFLRPEQTATTI
jgi:hypothetical protein